VGTDLDLSPLARLLVRSLLALVAKGHRRGVGAPFVLCRSSEGGLRGKLLHFVNALSESEFLGEKATRRGLASAP
jgi:hypothetical protein